MSACAFSLALAKFIIGIISGSVILLASALDSLFDTLFSISNYFALKKSKLPSNKYFNYGFGKIEGLAALFEGVMIFISGIFVIYKSISNFINDKAISNLSESIAVMLLSIVVTISLVLILSQSLKRDENLIINAEILHYKSDLLSNLAIIISLIFISLTGLVIIDVVIGGILGIYICYNAYKIVKSAFYMLLDRAVDDELNMRIKALLDSNSEITSYHDLKSRISGDTIFLECHLVFDDNNILLIDAHNISDKLERNIQKLSDNYKWIILIHLDPYDDSQIDVQC